RDLAVARARGQERRLVDQVRQVGPGEAGGLARQRVEVDVTGERLAPRVNFKDVFAAFAVGTVDDHLAVEAAGPQQRRVEDVGTVGRRDQDDVVLHFEAVHLDQ